MKCYAPHLPWSCQSQNNRSLAALFPGKRGHHFFCDNFRFVLLPYKGKINPFLAREAPGGGCGAHDAAVSGDEPFPGGLSLRRILRGTGSDRGTVPFQEFPVEIADIRQLIVSIPNKRYDVSDRQGARWPCQNAPQNARTRTFQLKSSLVCGEFRNRFPAADCVSLMAEP